ncbi:dynein axonemal light chain 1-like [Episyrphus balteatus]|uniref:dynein axonemal light chain 1-like n=1 Tax=Episyrphus balteatus TaxID=286459 RepID=UPI002485041C|nr:dynein axonemal light chain 1-like [Episyrphus balteatus]
MSKGIPIKDALKLWEEKTNKVAVESEDIGLQIQWPPIEKMDNTLSTLIECRKLSLSTNMIEKISGISGMKNLRILSLARNSIKNLQGIEVLSDTLEELWISYNLIEKLKPIDQMKVLKIFYVSNNSIKDWIEFNRMGQAPNLVEISFIGNPLCDTMDEGTFRAEAIKKLQNLKKFDGEPVIRGV